MERDNPKLKFEPLESASVVLTCCQYHRSVADVVETEPADVVETEPADAVETDSE